MARTATVKPVNAYRCSLRGVPGSGYYHLSGSGKPSRKRCTCGGAFIVESGWYAVFAWRGDGRYERLAALSLHRTQEAASADAMARGGDTHTSRWVAA